MTEPEPRPDPELKPCPWCGYPMRRLDEADHVLSRGRVPMREIGKLVCDRCESQREREPN